MSLINEALKRAEVIGRSEKTPVAKRSTHGIKHLYDDKVTGRPTTSDKAAEEDISRLLRTKQTSLRGAAALGVCVIASVAVIMHLTLPPDQRGPVEAEAGGATATLETQTPPSTEEAKAIPKETPEEPTFAALQQALTDALNRSAAQTPETTSPPEPDEAVQPDTSEKNSAHQPVSDKFTISAILASGGKGYAIVNGHMVTVGDNIDGAKVVTVGKHHVVLEKDGKQFTLRM